MSWQSYVDDQLIAGGLANAAILGLDGNPWAVSKGFSVPEGKAVVDGFKNIPDLQAKGFHINGQKYFGLRGDEKSYYGKKGAGGAIIVKTEQCVLVGVYDDKLQPGPAATTVEKLGDYLRENGY